MEILNKYFPEIHNSFKINFKLKRKLKQCHVIYVCPTIITGVEVLLRKMFLHGNPKDQDVLNKTGVVANTT